MECFENSLSVENLNVVLLDKTLIRNGFLVSSAKGSVKNELFEPYVLMLNTGKDRIL